MAFLTHFSLTPIHHHSSSLFTRFILQSKPKTLLILAALSSPQPATCHFSSTSTIKPLSSLEILQDLSITEEPTLQIAKEKLFIPPDTELSSEKPPRILKGSNIVLSKYAGDAQVISAEFVKSSVETEACPEDGSPEFALVGRSNVGKSSLVNSIVRRKKLALTSKTPGMHARYASAPNELRKDWNKFTKDYFINRSTLVSVFLLIDASIPAKKIDLEYASWLGQNQVPMTIIFTKCDKRKKKKNGGKHPEENVQDFQDLISEYFEAVPPWIMTSSVTNQGRDEILLHMSQLRNYWLKH
ncbi:hypothetical protein E3N88_15906 [Mikania micrantha]|uniref:G domain-containing protein n=1 Tax=Mikania micrantha TaxID=192012 RepID=A0A5N6NZI2_9ASTR|nr:hypothetical protein E3N88_15906 [Mikania micrantha]